MTLLFFNVVRQTKKIINVNIIFIEKYIEKIERIFSNSNSSKSLLPYFKTIPSTIPRLSNPIYDEYNVKVLYRP